MKYALRSDLPLPLPARIASLPVAENGYPVPWFVAWVPVDPARPEAGGRPEFRGADARKFKLALAERRCWVCGQALGAVGGPVAFVIGPMCSINRVSAEPPCHLECAEFSARACPFLSKPHMKRREAGLPDDLGAEVGMMIRRNPGVTAVWLTTVYQAFRAPRADGGDGILFDIGARPVAVTWWAEGRTATRAEVQESIRTGLPILAGAAEQDGPHAVAQLARQVAEAAAHLPPADQEQPRTQEQP